MGLSLELLGLTLAMCPSLTPCPSPDPFLHSTGQTQGGWGSLRSCESLCHMLHRVTCSTGASVVLSLPSAFLGCGEPGAGSSGNRVGSALLVQKCGQWLPLPHSFPCHTAVTFPSRKSTPLAIREI